MKTQRGWFVPTFVLFLLARSAAAIDVMLPDSPPPIVFDRHAQVTGTPPIVVRAGDTLTFSIVQDEELLRKQSDEVAEALLEAVAETERRINPGVIDRTILLGTTPERLKVLQATYCDRARTLIANGTQRADLSEQYRQVCTAVGGPIDPSVLPDFAATTTPYSVTLQCLDAALPEALAKKRGIVNGRLELSAAADGRCSMLQYELRQLRPLASAAAEWAKANPIPTALLQDLIVARQGFEALKPADDRLLAAQGDLPACLSEALLIPDDGTSKRKEAVVKCSGKPSSGEAETLLRDATGDMTNASRAILGLLLNQRPVNVAWVEKWLWFTAGRPTYHPLLADRGGVASDALKRARQELALLDAQLAMIDKLAPSAKLDTAAALQEAVQKLGRIRADRDTAAATVTRLTAAAAATATGRERDTLLYRGQLFVTRANEPLIAMRHHDAKADFVTLSGVTEIAENERLAVLAENADPALQLNIVQTVTAIGNDRGQFTDDLMRSSGQASPGRASLNKAARDYVEAHKVFAALLTMANEELLTPPTLIPLSADDTPLLVTKVVPHDVPGPAPANVKYTIRKREGTTDTEVGSGSYRLNHLYRARFRTGLLYSTLDQATVSSDGKKETHSRHGVDATFGVQTFFNRRDIRTIDWRHPAFSFYAGLTARDVTKNLLIGLGWEPIGGVTLTSGLHVGRSDRIDPDDADHVIEQWRRKPFVALTFDVDFLKQLLTLKPAL